MEQSQTYLELISDLLRLKRAIPEPVQTKNDRKGRSVTRNEIRCPPGIGFRESYETVVIIMETFPEGTVRMGEPEKRQDGGWTIPLWHGEAGWEDPGERALAGDRSRNLYWFR